MRTRRVVYSYSSKRHKRDDRSMNAVVERAEKAAAGRRPLKKDRFVTIRGANRSMNWTLVERGRQLASLKGYVINISENMMTGEAVISACHDLWQVE